MPRFHIGETVWFTKSGACVRVIEYTSRGRYIVEHLDTGKRMLATEDGLARERVPT